MSFIQYRSIIHKHSQKKQQEESQAYINPFPKTLATHVDPLMVLMHTGPVKTNCFCCRFFCGVSAPFPINPQGIAAAKACVNQRDYAEPVTTVRSGPRLLSQTTRPTLPWPVYARVATLALR